MFFKVHTIPVNSQEVWFRQKVPLIFHSANDVNSFSLKNTFLLSFIFLHQGLCHTRSLTVVCTAALLNWLFSFIYNVTYLYVNGNFTDVLCLGVCIAIFDGFSCIIDLLIVFVMPCTLIIILYTHVFVIAKKHATAIRALQVHNSTESSKNKISDKSERKAAMLLGILVFVFLLCLLPYYITALVIPYGSVIYMYVINVSVIVFFLNSTINPIIYALFYSWFKKSLKLIFTFKVFHKDSSLMNVM
nr:trace amine-associated receptor 13c-like [Danio rerio]|eukprot:XP_021329060.1 trace amine-associated receptor 13c-like [Danio rerio]